MLSGAFRRLPVAMYNRLTAKAVGQRPAAFGLEQQGKKDQLIEDMSGDMRHHGVAQSMFPI